MARSDFAGVVVILSWRSIRGSEGPSSVVRVHATRHVMCDVAALAEHTQAGTRLTVCYPTVNDIVWDWEPEGNAAW